MANQADGNPTADSGFEKVIPHSPYVPYDPNVRLYVGTMRKFLVPYEYTGWRDETMAWKESCYLHGNLNPTPTFRIKGPDALKFLSGTCVNGFSKFPVGTGKHAIMCREDGIIMQDGVLLRLAEDDFITYWMAPYIVYALEKGKYRAVGENLTGKVFLFQVAGPRSLEILEAATSDNLHDIGFIDHRENAIAGKKVRILRLGMAGSLAYEVHGQFEDACTVHSAIFEAGQPYGIRRLGFHAYMMNHTEDGFPQAYYHFIYPWKEDKDFEDYLQNAVINPTITCLGSMGTDVKLRYRNPVELGWGGMIKFDHDFVGRKALEKEVANPRRKMVTLEWNTKDIIDVYASQFRPGEPYINMDEPYHFNHEDSTNTLYADQVLKDGKLIGVSSGRAYSYNYRKMISLCSLDVEYGNLGTEVAVLWGNPGSRQKEIRATVSRFPYFNEDRNQTVDVSKIPYIATEK